MNEITENSSPNFYFKQTWCGEVLMIKDRRAGYIPGEWIYFFRKAKSHEAQALCNFI